MRLTHDRAQDMIAELERQFLDVPEAVEASEAVAERRAWRRISAELERDLASGELN